MVREGGREGEVLFDSCAHLLTPPSLPPSGPGPPDLPVLHSFPLEPASVSHRHHHLQAEVGGKGGREGGREGRREGGRGGCCYFLGLCSHNV